MRTVEFCRKSSDVGTLVYCITAGDALSEDGEPLFEVYGLAVTNACSGETSSVENITTSLAGITAMAERVSSGLVTPCALRDVVCDLVAGDAML